MPKRAKSMFGKKTGRYFLLILLLAVLAAIQFAVLEGARQGGLLFLIIIDICLLTGFYSFRGLDLLTLRSPNALLFSSFMGGITGSLAALLLYILFFSGHYAGRAGLEVFLTAIVSLAVFPAVSFGFYRLMHKRTSSIACYIIGSKDKFSGIIEEIEQVSHRKLISARWVGTSRQLREIEGKNPETHIIVAADWKLYQQLKEDIQILISRGYRKYFLMEIAEMWLNRIPLKLIDEFPDYFETVFADTEHLPPNRAFDIILAVFIGTLLLPITLTVCALVCLTTGFPLLFRQHRVGLHEREFLFYKFRSLKHNQGAAVNKCGEVLEIDEAFEIEELEDPHGEVDQRVTPVGRLLRRIRLDEIPQLLNVLNGTMSLVGPRPEMICYHTRWKESIPYYTYRNRVKPGLTGWAQIHYLHTTTFAEYKIKTEYDLYYIKNKSLLLDLQIVFLTLEAMLPGIPKKAFNKVESVTHETL
jgi:lipopolysaccharide/colanic/teichoic acid biosynthesis glycosyltransferase